MQAPHLVEPHVQDVDRRHLRAVRAQRLQAKTLTKDASALNEFLVALKEDEVVFTSSFLRYMVPGTNPSACEVALASGATLVGPVYLAYRKSDDNPVLKRFVSLYRREAQKHQAQVRWSMQG